MAERRVVPPVRDYLYQEGIILGDFVVSEFFNSGKILGILHEDKSVRAKMHARLRQELASHRQRCLEALEQCEFIDMSASVSSPETLSQSVVVPPSPAEVSRHILEALRASPLNVHSFKPLKITHERGNERKSGIFSGLSITDTPSSRASSLEPPTPTELLLRPDHILESAFPMELYGVLDQAESKRSTQRGARVPFSRKRRRGLSEGFFHKDGSYHALVYGGFAHLCGGALEWPFRTCEIAFTDFFTLAKQI